MNVKSDHRSKFSNLSNWKEEARTSTGFEPVTTANTGAMLYQLSCKPHIGSEVNLLSYRGQFIERNKLTSLPMCGFIAQSVEHRTGIRGGHGFEPR